MKQPGFFLFRMFKRSAALLVIGALLLVLPSACCVAKKYEGPSLSNDEVALIRPDDKQFTHVSIISMDEKVLKTTESSVAVLPGPHVLFLEAWLDYPFVHKNLYFNLRLPFEAEAGDVYTLHATILPEKNKGFVWLTSEKDPEKFIAKQYATNMMLIHFE